MKLKIDKTGVSRPVDPEAQEDEQTVMLDAALRRRPVEEWSKDSIEYRDDWDEAMEGWGD